MEKYKKGDISSQEMLKFRKVEKAFLTRCEEFAYREIKTATIEPLHLFTATEALTPELLKKIYSFVDWGGWSGERVVLRPDSTISSARYYLDYLKDQKQAKLCYMENHFTLGDEGEVSERWQFGLENIGNNAPVADVETIFIARDCLLSTGIEDIYLHLSFPGVLIEVLKLILNNVKDLDKVLKLLKENRLEEIEEYCSSEGYNSLVKILQFKGKNHSFLKNLALDFKDSEEIQNQLQRFQDVCIQLELMNCDYEINFSLSKNFDYYTGIQFEFLSRPVKRNRKDILCSGGRYDQLLGVLGKSNQTIPSVGAALYVKNIIDLIEEEEEENKNIALTVAELAGKNIKAAQFLATELKELGFKPEIHLSGITTGEIQNFGLVIELGLDNYKDGFKLLSAQSIGKPLVKNILKGYSADE